MGLVLKDFLCLRRVLRSMLLVAAFYIMLSVTANFSLSLAAGMVTLLLSFMAANCFSYDKAAGWDVYARTFPLSRARQVSARYLTVLLLMAAGWVLSLAVAGVGSLFGQLDDWSGFLTIDMVYICMALIFNAVMLPLLYKFGAERARVLIYAVMAGLFLLGWLFFTALGGEEFLETMDMDKVEISPAPVAAMLILSALVLMGLSFPLSLHFYRKQEL